MRYTSIFSKWLSVLLVLMCIILPVQAEDIPDGQDMSGDLPPVQEILPVNITLPASVAMASRTPGAALPGKDVFPVTITPLTEGAPGPHSTQIHCVDTASVDLIFGSYTQPGEYSYQLTLGKSALTDWIVDDREETFTVTVTVTEGEEGSLTAAVSPEAISVTKTYLEPLVIDVEKKWPDGGERPVTVWLYETRNGEKVEVGKITVAATTGWRGQFTQDKTLGVNLRPNGIYTVEEMDLYKFSESYSYNKNDPLHWVVTVTNKEALPQTGLRTEPVFFLFLTGMLCMAAGAFLLKKKDIYG